MSTIESALKSIGGKGAKVTQVIPAHAIALAGISSNSPGSSHGSVKKAADQPFTERRPTLS